MTRRIFVFLSVLGGVLVATHIAQAGHGANLVISEVQITGGAGMTTNDFVEIYNPTSAPIDLEGMRLVKRTATGTTDTTLKSWTSSALVPAHDWYLWANSGFTTIGTTPDTTTTGTLADGNGVALRMGAEDTGTIVDSVGWGTAMNAFVEGAPFPTNPGAGASIERMPGGTEGNGTDTNVNASDFMLRGAAGPQNSASTPSPPLPALPPADEPPPPPPPAPTGPMPGDLVVNEFMPNPLDGIEWIEIYNKTAAEADMTGWKLIDGTDATVKSLSGTIAAGGFAAFDLSSARLNNSGDIVIIQAPDGTVIDRVSYGDWNDGVTGDNAPAPAKAGQSVARKSNGGDSGSDKDDFALSDQPTKGASNVIAVTETVTQGGTDVVSAPRVVPRPKIVINEFVADPEDGPEWVELYNAGEVTVDLEGFWIEEGTERKTKLSGTLVPGAFLMVEEIKGNLNNRGDIVRLKNEIGEAIDWVSYGAWEDGKMSDNAPVAKDPYSVARIRDGEDTGNDADDFTVTSVVTKGRANVIEGVKPPLNLPLAKGEKAVAETPLPLSTPTPLPPADVTGKLFISEFLPDPEGSDSEEWVELFWAGAQLLKLKGFVLDDAEGGSRSFTIPELNVAPGSWAVLPRSLTKLALNNTEDAVRLFAPDGTLLDEVIYEGSLSALSYARREDGSWFWTNPTPGARNAFSRTAVADADEARAGERAIQASKAAKAARQISLEEVHGLELGSRVAVRGVVSVPPGPLGAQIFYISGSGIQVYMFKKDFPPLEVGDRVRVEGERSSVGGEARLKTKTRADIVVEGKGAPPQAHKVSAEMIGEDLEGGLVALEGVLIDVGRGGMILDDGGGEAVIYVKPTTGIDTRELVPGTRVRASGIVGQTKSGYRVMPRFQEDIEILGYERLDGLAAAAGVEDGDRTKESHPYAKATAAAGGGAALAAAAVRRRKLFFTGARAALFLFKRGKNGAIS